MVNRIRPGPVGLLGGSFDPIHVAHLRLADAALRALGLAEVRLIPAGRPWQKAGLADAGSRIAMVEAAIAGDPRLVLDRREIDRPGPTYTIDTLREIRAEAGPATSLVLLVGADQLQRFDTWREWRSILDLAHLGVALRAGTAPTPDGELATWVATHRADPDRVRSAPAGTIVDIPMAPFDGSATEIRRLLREPSSTASGRLAELLPPPVLDYIRAHHPYADGAGH